MTMTMSDRVRKFFKTSSHNKKKVEKTPLNPGAEASTFPRRETQPSRVPRVQVLPATTKHKTEKPAQDYIISEITPAAQLPEQFLQKRNINADDKNLMHTIQEDTSASSTVEKHLPESIDKTSDKELTSSYAQEAPKASHTTFSINELATQPSAIETPCENQSSSFEETGHLNFAPDPILSDESLIPDPILASDVYSTDDFSSWVDNTEGSRLHRHQACFLPTLDDAIRPRAIEVLQPTYEDTTRQPVTREHVTQHHAHKLFRHIKHERHQYLHEHIIQPIREEAVLDLQLHSHELPSLSHEHKQSRQDSTQKLRIENDVLRHLSSETHLLPDTRSYIEETPVHEEAVHKHVIREFHPVIERYVRAPHEHRYQQHIHELHIEHPTYAEVSLLEPISMEEWMAKTRSMKLL